MLAPFACRIVFVSVVPSIFARVVFVLAVERFIVLWATHARGVLGAGGARIARVAVTPSYNVVYTLATNGERRGKAM